MIGNSPISDFDRIWMRRLSQSDPSPPPAPPQDTLHFLQYDLKTGEINGTFVGWKPEPKPGCGILKTEAAMINPKSFSVDLSNKSLVAKAENRHAKFSDLTR
jgi:hypothetical protein